MINMTATIRLTIIAALAASLVVSSISGIATQAFADKKLPASGNHTYKVNDKNMDIKKAYIDGTNLVVKVKGTAGATVPDKPAPDRLGQVFVYAFVTDAGIMVINAHWECHVLSSCDPTEQHVSEWHAEFVTLGHVDGHAKDCVTSIYGERSATVSGHYATVDTPEASKISAVKTA